MQKFLKSSEVLCLKFVGIALLLSSGATLAANRIFDLHLKNGAGNEPVIFVVNGRHHHCYEGNVGLGRQIGGTVAAGDHVTVRLARVQGHGCDPLNGRFAIEVSSHPGVIITFSMNNSGQLWLDDPIKSRPYGRLSQKDPKTESYTWETIPKMVVTAGKAVGSWVRVCQQFCNKTLKTELINSSTNSTEKSSEVKNALSASLSAGIQFKVFSAGATVGSSHERTTGQRMSQELSTSGSSGTEETVSLSLEQMEERNLFAVWQWVATSRLSNGETIVMRTVKYTCTPDANPPTYFPDSNEDVNACQRRKPVITQAASAPVQEPATVRAPPPSPPATAQSSVASRRNAVATQLDAVVTNGAGKGFAHVNNVIGLLSGGSASPQRSLGRLQSGYSYAIIVVGDDQTALLDLSLIDATGRTMASNAVEGRPFARQLEFSPATDQLFNAVVSMKNCRADLCNWGLAIMRKPR